jgi:hypothetical protein
MPTVFRLEKSQIKVHPDGIGLKKKFISTRQNTQRDHTYIISREIVMEPNVGFTARPARRVAVWTTTILER